MAASASANINAAMVLCIWKIPPDRASEKDDGKASQNARDGSTC
jgi:hypothetical protein